MVRPEDRPAIKRIIRTIFQIEDDYREELMEIVEDVKRGKKERAEAYLDLICDHMELINDTEE